MTDLGTAQERLEAAIVQLEKALDSRSRKNRDADKDAAAIKKANAAVAKRLDSAIERLRALLDG
ncbi:MAG: hypothetical protein GY791_04915 [Alphaproteobacteria bacterium]|nr:hypothetical protein [Alphaproteobacteria bacterium]